MYFRQVVITALPSAFCRGFSINHCQPPSDLQGFFLPPYPKSPSCAHLTTQLHYTLNYCTVLPRTSHYSPSLNLIARLVQLYPRHLHEYNHTIMDSPAFAVTGMFTATKVGTSSFVNNKVGASTPCAASTRPVTTMAVDAFQKKFQSLGKINVDYSRPKKLATYKRSGYPVSFDYPTSPAGAGHYSVSNCNVPGGAAKILMKYDEYCAKGMNQVYKRSAVPFGTYTTKCAEGTVRQAAYQKRVFNRTAAFRQAQKPVNVRLHERYENRRACFILSNCCSREEDQFKSMPMSCATYLACRAEAAGTCFRTVTPSSLAENYMASSVKSQLTQIAHPTGIYRVGVCEDGHASGDAEERRIASLASEFRAYQQSAAAVTGQQYESARTALKLYAHNCHHEEQQIYSYPAVAAAMCRH